MMMMICQKEELSMNTVGRTKKRKRKNHVQKKNKVEYRCM